MRASSKTAVSSGSDPSATAARSRILEAAFCAFTETGYAQTSTLEIASRAKVSKRELYSLVGNKKEILVTCISERAKRLQIPADLPIARDHDTLKQALTQFGELLLREVADPAVIGMFRLAAAEAERVPAIARALDAIGRQTSRLALKEILAQARSSGVLRGDPEEMTEQFAALLWGDLFVKLLLGLAGPPNPKQAKRRARDAAAVFLRIQVTAP